MKRLLALSLSLLTLCLTACSTSSTASDLKPTINSFTASPPSLPAGGGSVTLSWDVKDAKSLSIDNGVGTVTGTSKTVSVTSNKTFVLTATNDAGSTTQTTSVSVGAGADTTPPTVISVDPPDGATGVRSDAVIVITFSEMMDQKLTESAYQSLDLPASDVTFYWNDAGTVLEIESKDFLEYARGDALTIAAKRYALSLSSTAKDVAGNALAPFSSSFSTLRLISTQLPSVANQDGYIYSDGTVDSGDTNLLVGDYRDNTGIRGFLSFDLTSVPDGAEVRYATMHVYKGRVFNTPYVTLGSVSLARADYRESLTSSDYERPVNDSRVFDTSSAASSGWVSSEVTDDVQTDLANRATRGNRTQYRLGFGVRTDNNNLTDFVQFETTERGSDYAPYIQMDYLTP